MKNKKGFTLIELLAVIVVLAIIMVIAGSNLIGTKREANIAEAKKIEKMIEDLGPSVYLDYKDTDPYVTYYINQLHSDGYLKSSTIKNPSGKEDCTGYLNINDESDGPVFEAHICCPGLYETGETNAPDICN